MAGDATHDVGASVVHFARQGLATLGGELGGRDAILDRISGKEEGVVHAQRIEDILGEEVIEALAGGGFDDEAEHVGAEIGVFVAAPRAHCRCVAMTWARACAGECAVRNRLRPAGRPERCSSSMRTVTRSLAPPLNSGMNFETRSSSDTFP